MTNYKKLVKAWTIVMVVLIGLLGAGCLLNERDVNSNLLMRKDGEVAQDSLNENSESGINTEPIDDREENIQPVEDPLEQLANQHFSIGGQYLSEEDDETIVEFGKAFINLFHGAIAKRQKVSFERYISNKNLQKFADKMLDLTQKQDLQGDNMVIYGLYNEFKQPRMENIADNVYYLKLPFEFKGSGMTCQMLITAENKTLKLLDFYFGNKDGVDTFATGHPAERRVNNPSLWDDNEWVKGVFDKLKAWENEEAEGRFPKVILSHPNSNIAYCYVVTSDAYILKEDIPNLIAILKHDSWYKTGNIADEDTPRDIIINFNEFPVFETVLKEMNIEFDAEGAVKIFTDEHTNVILKVMSYKSDPNSKIFREVLRHYSINPNKVLHIGDSSSVKSLNEIANIVGINDSMLA